MIDDPDNPELTEDDFALMRPASEVLSPKVMNVFRRTRGPQKAPTKLQVTLRLDEDVLADFKAEGAGWQSRINQTLRQERAAFHIVPRQGIWEVRLPKGERLKTYKSQAEAIKAASSMAETVERTGVPARVIVHSADDLH